MIYLPEIPWLSILMGGGDPCGVGVAFAPCPLCNGPKPLIEDTDPTGHGVMFVCLAGLGGCGERFYVDYARD